MTFARPPAASAPERARRLNRRLPLLGRRPIRGGGLIGVVLRCGPLRPAGAIPASWLHYDGVFQLITFCRRIAVFPLGAFLIEGQWALRSCGSPSGALHPMLCQRGLAPFYRPAIRSVQTAQELQIVRGA
jgi:hypothetical protein